MSFFFFASLPLFCACSVIDRASRDIDPILAKSIAEGYHDPTTRLPMKDINPGFVPRALRTNRRVSNSPIRNPTAKGKGKGRQSLPTPGKAPAGGILSFFGKSRFPFRMLVILSRGLY